MKERGEFCEVIVLNVIGKEAADKFINSKMTD